MARVIQRFSKTGFTRNRPRKGRSKKLCLCCESGAEAGFKKQTHELQHLHCLEVAEVEGQLVSAQTIHHALQQVGLHRPRRKPILKLAHKKLVTIPVAPKKKKNVMRHSRIHTSCLRLNANDHNWWTTMPVKRHQKSGAEKSKRMKTKPVRHFHNPVKLLWVLRLITCFNNLTKHLNQISTESYILGLFDVEDTASIISSTETCGHFNPYGFIVVKLLNFFPLDFWMLEIIKSIRHLY